MNITLKDIFSKESIIKRAKENWDLSSTFYKVKKAPKKYNHIFRGKNIVINDWNNIFDNLAVPQKRILIKGELIRTYDDLPNSDKTKIKKLLNLSVFSSKWYRLPKEDKNKLLKHIYVNNI